MLSDQRKFDQLLQALRPYRKIAVAFSGGVDSTLLLYAALAALGPENVLPLFARSILSSSASLAGSRGVFEKNFPHAISLVEIAVLPLSWPEFVANDNDRCYYCKKRMYTALLENMPASGFATLADGTNSDDRHEERPGLRAVSELGVITPLADVGLTKPEVRLLAQALGLSNFDLPSNSCLATRTPAHTPITEETLRIIEMAEHFLHGNGFLGCRVRVHPSCTIVEVHENDINAFCHAQNRARVQAYFMGLHLAPVVLSLTGR